MAGVSGFEWHQSNTTTVGSHLSVHIGSKECSQVLITEISIAEDKKGGVLCIFVFARATVGFQVFG